MDKGRKMKKEIPVEKLTAGELCKILINEDKMNWEVIVKDKKGRRKRNMKICLRELGTRPGLGALFG